MYLCTQTMTTITDIALALGITPSTVSRALAGNPRVKEKTRLAVEKKAAEMAYERNIVASNLRKGRSNIVGIVVPRVRREFFSNFIGGAEFVLSGAGYNVIICQSRESLDAEIKALKALKNYRVAGVIISHSIESTNGDHIREILGELPLIQFDRVFPDLPGAKVVGANCDGAYQATKHLIDKGYKRIGTIAGYMSCMAFVERLAGYRMALEDAGMRYDESIVYPESILYETGKESARKAIAEGCDALYCCGDYAALGAMDAVKEAGLSIPGDFGIVGTADEFWADIITPSLSSLGQHPFDMGQAAARAFLDGRTGTEVVPMELHVRQSSNKQ